MILHQKYVKKIFTRPKNIICFLFLMFSVVCVHGALNDTLPRDSAVDVVKITRSWTLPATLRNISAIDFISPGRLACLQDEIGSIFIFNLETSLIENEIPFGPPGDYEGLALVKNTAYIACADGRILEIEHYTSDTPHVTEYGTHLTVEDKMNGLCYDRKNKRLLVSVRGSENAGMGYKGIYAFNLAQKRMVVSPVIKIDLKSKVFNGLQPRNIQTVFQPADLHIHPRTGLLYIVDATRRQLLRMRLSESIRDLRELNKSKIYQPEGITFTPSGDLYIASQGDRDEPGKLLQVRLP